MRLTLLVSLLVATPLAAVTEAPHDLGITEDALAADEECSTNASPGCALNALQLRGQKTAAADEDSFAEASASAEEADLAGASAHAHEDALVGEVAPGVFVELDQRSVEAEEGERFFSSSRRGAEADEEEEEESEGARRRGGAQRRWGSSNRRRSSSRNMCCKCRSGTVSWSQSGTCSHCQQGGILKTVKPPAKCQQGSSSWSGNPTYCAKECQKLVGASSSGSNTATGGSGPHLGSSPGAGCSNKTGGSCRLLGCAKSRGGKSVVKCVKGKCECQAGHCASGGKCMPR